MKKYILLLVSVFAFGQASNQMVTFTEAQSLGFTLKSGQSHVTSNQCMTKSEALAKYNLSTSEMDGYASNQLVPRRAWVSGVIGTSHNISFSQFSTTTLACENRATTNMGDIGYTNGVQFNNGVVIYTDSGLTTPLSVSNLYLVLGSDRQYIGKVSTTGVISEYQICAVSPTYTQVFGKYEDPCGSQLNNLYEDSSGKYYLLVSGNYSLLNGYIYTYIGPINSNLYRWLEGRYINGETDDNIGVDNPCAPN